MKFVFVLALLAFIGIAFADVPSTPVVCI